MVVAEEPRCVPAIGRVAILIPDSPCFLRFVTQLHVDKRNVPRLGE